MTTITLEPSMKLSQNFSLSEAIRSSTADRLGIINMPDNYDQLRNLVHTAERMQLVRSTLNNQPINVTSWLRNTALNKAVDGVSNSAHMRGLAVDFICPRFGNAREVCRRLVANKEYLNYDQLILEDFPNGAVIHIAFPGMGDVPRRQDLFTRDLKSYTLLTYEELNK